MEVPDGAQRQIGPDAKGIVSGILRTADIVPECACGASFESSAKLTEHILELYPPHAETPLDGAHHENVTNWLPWVSNFPQDPRYPQSYLLDKLHSTVRYVLQYREHLDGQIVPLLQEIESELGIRADMLRYTKTWAFNRRKYLRLAAAIEYRIDRGDLKPGDVLRQTHCARDHQVSARTAWGGLSELGKRDILAFRKDSAWVVPSRNP